jgi:SNF family Na+-dependent transporter
MTGGRKINPYIFRGMNMESKNWSVPRAIIAFLIGVILLWSFGSDWLTFESPLVMLVALVGVALSVSIFAIWKLSHRSPDDK